MNTTASRPQRRRSSIFTFRRMSGFESMDNLFSINNRIDTFFEEIEPMQNEVFDFQQKPTVDTNHDIPALPQIPSNTSQMRRLSLTIDEFILDSNNNDKFDFSALSQLEPSEIKDYCNFGQETSEPQQDEKALLLDPIPYTSIDPLSAPAASQPIANDFSTPSLTDFEQTFRTQLERLISCMNKSRQTRHQVARVKKLLNMQGYNTKSTKSKNACGTKEKIHKRRRSSIKHTSQTFDFCF